MLDSYNTITKDTEVIGEFEDRRSRFIAQLCKVSSEKEADAFLATIRARHHDARHNVPAWILSDGRERCSDDGEPQRTAGMPVLEVLRGANLKDVCCVVTRYFGGTLLGPGGLVRAYTQATQQALQNAEANKHIVCMTLVTRVCVVLPYSAYERVRRLIEDCGGKVQDTIFAEDVQINSVFLTNSEGTFLSTMKELANGEELCTVSEPVFAEF